MTFGTVRVTCRSDSYDSCGDYAGVLVYDIGTFPAKETFGNNIKPGWILIKDTSKLSKTSTEGQVHGDLIKNFFGMEPKQLIQKYNAVFAGFAIMKGVFKVNSLTLNTGTRFHNSKRNLNDLEERLLRGAVE